MERLVNNDREEMHTKGFSDRFCRKPPIAEAFRCFNELVRDLENSASYAL
jgi:hypothetical protein